MSVRTYFKDWVNENPTMHLKVHFNLQPMPELLLIWAQMGFVLFLIQGVCRFIISLELKCIVKDSFREQLGFLGGVLSALLL